MMQSVARPTAWNAGRIAVLGTGTNAVTVLDFRGPSIKTRYYVYHGTDREYRSYRYSYRGNCNGWNRYKCGTKVCNAVPETRNCRGILKQGTCLVYRRVYYEPVQV